MVALQWVRVRVVAALPCPGTTPSYTIEFFVLRTFPNQQWPYNAKVRTRLGVPQHLVGSGKTASHWMEWATPMRWIQNVMRITCTTQ